MLAKKRAFISPISWKSHSPSTAHRCFDRSIADLSNMIYHYAQSSLLMRFSGWKSGSIGRIFEKPTPLIRWIENILKMIDSDSPGNGKSESIIGISLAQRSTKLRGLQGSKCIKGTSRGASGILTIVLQQKVV
jgi:hypothetical protein